MIMIIIMLIKMIANDPIWKWIDMDWNIQVLKNLML